MPRRALWLLALLALLLSGRAQAAGLAEARARVDRQDYAGALAEYATPLAARPDDSDLLIEVARVNAWADHHPEAIRLYRRVLEVAPARRRDVLLALAWQLTWAGRHAEASPLFREVAGWGGPSRPEALRGLAESLNGEGRHRQAAAAYRDAAEESPGGGDGALRREWARTLYWAGYDEQALARLAGAEDPASVALRDRVDRGLRSAVSFAAEPSRDSDDLYLRPYTLGWAHRLPDGAVVQGALRYVDLERDGESASGREARLGYGWRAGEPYSGPGPSWKELSVGVRDYDGWQTGLWRVRGRWAPADLWRLDLEAGNEVVETVDAVREGVSLNQVSGGFDYRFAPRWQATLGAGLLLFDDDNLRRRLAGRVEYLGWDRPRLTVGLAGIAFDDSRPEIDRGYYNPETYREVRLLSRLEVERDGWLLEARLEPGWLWEEPGESGDLLVWEVAVTRELPSARLRLVVGRSDSLQLGAGGGGGVYWREYLGLVLEYLY
jgi:tetratricopeptide (TPR) repeat protein